MMGLVVGVAGGLLGHQTDGLFKRLERGNTPPSWTLLSRYGVGVFLDIGTLVVLLDEDGNGRQDVALKALASAVAVGSGVSAGHLLDYLRESPLSPYPPPKQTARLLPGGLCLCGPG